MRAMAEGIFWLFFQLIHGRLHVGASPLMYVATDYLLFAFGSALIIAGFIEAIVSDN